MLYPTVQIQPALFTKELINNLINYLNNFKAVPVSVQRHDGNGHLYSIEQMTVRWKYIDSSVDMSALNSPALGMENSTLDIGRYLSEFLERMPPQEHETFLHPVCKVNLVTASGQTGPEVKTLESEPFVNPDVLNFYLVLALDDSETEIATQTLNQIKKQHGLACYLLHLRPLHSGQFQTPQNDQNLQLFLREFISQNIISFMDRQCQLWNDQYMSSRRGLTGRLFQVGKKYFSAASGGSSGKSSSNIRQISISPSTLNYNKQTLQFFPFSSPEAFLRRLADFSFMLNDFKFAQIVYESLKKDFQTEKAYRYYAGAQEMIGLCQLKASPGEKRDGIESNFESAVSTYLDQGYMRDAFKCSLLYHYHYKSMSMHKEAGKVLTRMINEVSTSQSALLCEQTAHCYMGMQPRQVRKYSFYLFLAAEKYIQCNQNDNAIRCLQKSIEFIQGKRWSLILDSVNFHLASLFLKEARLKESVETSLKLLYQSRSNAKNQELYLSFFIKVYKQLKPTDPDQFHVPLPDVKLSTLRIFPTGSSQLQMDIDHQEESNLAQWKELEKDFAKTSIDKQNQSFAVREPISVCLQIQNPLSVQLELDRLDLICEFKNDQLEDKKASAEEEKYYKHDGYWIEKRTGIVLLPFDIVELEWKILPQKPGQLLIKGLKFTLNQGLPLRTSLVSTTKTNERKLSIQITPPKPRLEVSLAQPLPESLLSGELVPLTILCRNVGEQVVSNVRVKMSHPTFFLLKDMLPVSIDVNVITVDNDLFDKSIIKIPLPNMVIQPGECQQIQLMFRGDRIGKHIFKFLFEYGHEASIRYQKFAFSSVILPSLKIGAFTRMSSRALDRHILGVEVENLLPDSEVCIDSIKILSPRWSLVNKNDSSHPEPPLAAGQTQFSYFELFSTSNFDGKTSPEFFTAQCLGKILLGTSKDLPVANKVKLKQSTEGVPPVNDHSSGFPVLLRQQWRFQQMQNIFSEIKPALIRKAFTLYQSNDVDLIVSWTIPKMNKSGQHYVIGISLAIPQDFIPKSWNTIGKLQNSTGRSLYAQTEHERKALIKSILHNKSVRYECPVRCLILCKDEYSLEFSSQGWPSIQVQFHLINLSWCEPWKFTLKLLNDDEGLVIWRGSDTRTGELQAGELLNIDISVHVLKSGIYDLNNWQLTVSRLGDDFVYTAPNPCFVRISIQ